MADRAIWPKGRLDGTSRQAITENALVRGDPLDGPSGPRPHRTQMPGGTYSGGVETRFGQGGAD